MLELIHSIKLDLLDCVIARARLCHGMELLDSEKYGDLVGLSTTHVSGAHLNPRPHDTLWPEPVG